MRKLLFPVFIFILALSSFSFTYKVDKVNWYTWEQATELSEKNQKKMLVFIVTDKCNWCKKMENSTFDETHIASYVNQNFYPVKFNAQQKESITFNGREYNFVKQNKGGGYHELAAALTDGRLVYPTSVFLDENNRKLQSIQGYQDKEVFEMILTFYGEDNHMKTPWKKYKNTYTPMTEGPKKNLILISDDKN